MEGKAMREVTDAPIKVFVVEIDWEIESIGLLRTLAKEFMIPILKTSKRNILIFRIDHSADGIYSEKKYIPDNIANVRFCKNIKKKQKLVVLL